MAREISRERFIQGIVEWFKCSGYRVAGDVSGLPSKIEEAITHKAAELLVGLLGFHSGATGTKEVTAGEASRALSGFADGSDAFGWRLGAVPVLIPVFCLADDTPDEEQELLQACFEAAKKVVLALSEIKYGGSLCIFPLLVYFDKARYERSLARLNVEMQSKTWSSRVNLIAGLVDVRGQRVRWPEQAFSKAIGDYAQSIVKRPEIFGLADLQSLLRSVE